MAVTTYTSLPNTAVQAGGRPRGSTVTALRDNPIAIAECDASAPVNAACWHPYNKVTGSDGLTGKIYDFATDGAVASDQTTVFVDGWEYRIRFDGISTSSGADILLELRRETAGSYSGTAILISPSGASSLISGYIELLTVRQSLRQHVVRGVLQQSLAGSNALAAATAVNLSQDLTAADMIDRARISAAAGTIDGGMLYLDKRRVYY